MILGDETANEESRKLSTLLLLNQTLGTLQSPSLCFNKYELLNHNLKIMLIV
jgi:hypothetical protein